MATQTELGMHDKEEIKAGEAARHFSFMEFLREARSAFIKITWPSREQIMTEFISVLILVSILTGIIYLIDKVFSAIVNFFTGKIF